MTATASLNKLKEGNARFLSGKTVHTLQDYEIINALTEGQKPFAIILGCSDSRVIPELAFDTGLGDLFVVRVAGNVANTSSIASIEYAVAYLGTPLIVVLAHESCGAVTAAVAGGDNGPNLNHLLRHIATAVEKTNSDVVDDVALMNAQITMEDLFKRSAIISDAVKQNKLEIHTAFYHLADGKVVFDD